MKIYSVALVSLFGFLFGCGVKTLPTGDSSNGSQTKSNTVSILTYNIHHANPPSKPGVIDIDAIANVIKQQQPDLVALQEVDVHTNRSGTTMHEAEEIARLAGMKAFFAKAIDYGGGEYGVAILSKFPMENLRNISLPTDDNTKGEHRTLAMATIVLPHNKKFVFACTHLDAQHDDVNRQMQIKKIIEVAKDESLPVVIAGDLNALPTSDVIKQLDGVFTRTCVGDCPFTIPEKNPNRTIDYIAFAPASTFSILSHAVVDESYASDHRPVKAILQLR
ncbi:endonuclease/exonuclease/phosphatase family protein [Flavisolibacter ginsenosidimutans]|uniref:Endonuclease/exonuclease/phosphatase n=1 Tax=Flavisolibacter ginsenosidimutans TaxID=661481 RepID=A0A5B8UJP9_9BACT|nr:endonuclease/exonuclease/phosphatase family protein [Flavisolibacter ginsenosidimutans]QEC56290.1 endonuclease/exonuclease/phosphatase [Flavisolibacter ginsenosidimutans]